MRYVKNNVNFKKNSKRSRGRNRRLAALLVLALVIALAIVVRPRSHATALVRVQHTPAPESIAAVRRAYAPAWGSASRAELQQELRTALSTGTGGARDWSCVVIAQDGSILYDDRSTHAVEPASVEKLIVTDASLTKLGPRYRFDTLLAATQTPRDGTLDGDIWLVGSGDPSLRSEDLRAGIDSLHKSGIDAIDGRLVVDGSAIAGEEINPLWNADDSNESFMAATSGMSLDEDTVEFDVSGTSPGQAAQVRIRPKSSDVHYSGSIITGDGDDVIVAGTEKPNEFRLEGSIPPGVQEKYWLPVHGIPQYTAAVAEQFLHAAGVTLSKPPLTGTVPLDAQILWEHRSMPLPVLLKHMLIHSDNHFAEQLMRTLAQNNGDEADDSHGIAQERTVLNRQDIPTPHLYLVDGSGLAHADRIAGITLARILSHFDSDPQGNALYPLLPRGGKDGTLRMYQFASAAGRVRAKSGHLADAASLAGYVDTRKHGRVVFVFMINGSPGDPDAAIVSAVDRISEH